MTTIELKPTSEPLAAAARAAILADPGFGRLLHRPHGHGQLHRRPRLARRAAAPLRPARARPGRPPRCTTGRRSSRASRPTASRTARSPRSARRPTPRGSSARPAGWRMPELPEELFLDAIDALVRQDRAWVPDDRRSLYLRPFMIATESGLGVNRPAGEYLFMLIASPSGGVLQRRGQAGAVWLCEDYVRAAPGGTGEAKCAGNYAASFLAQSQAVEQGCDQVVLARRGRAPVGRGDGRNEPVLRLRRGDDARLLTPALTGSLLPGITRDSLLTAAADLGIPAEEGRITVDAVARRHGLRRADRGLRLRHRRRDHPGRPRQVADRRDWTVADGEPGPVTLRLREAPARHPVRPAPPTRTAGSTRSARTSRSHCHRSGPRLRPLCWHAVGRTRLGIARCGCSTRCADVWHTR